MLGNTQRHNTVLFLTEFTFIFRSGSQGLLGKRAVYTAVPHILMMMNISITLETGFICVPFSAQRPNPTLAIFNNQTQTKYIILGENYSYNVAVY